MSNTVNYSDEFAHVVFDGSTNFDLASECNAPHGVNLLSIVIKTPSAGASFILRDVSATGVIIFPGPEDTAYMGQTKNFFGARVFPYVKGTEVTANTEVTFQYKKTLK